jgi:hypothetical protein
LRPAKLPQSPQARRDIVGALDLYDVTVKLDRFMALLGRL